MSSVTGNSPCPKCENELTYDYNIKTQEEYGACMNCGYSYSQTLKRKETGELDRIRCEHPLDGSVHIELKKNEEPYTRLAWLPITSKYSAQDIIDLLNKKVEPKACPYGPYNLYDGQKVDKHCLGYVIDEKGKQCFYRGDNIIIDTENNLFIVEECQWVNKSKGGYGAIMYNKIDNIVSALVNFDKPLDDEIREKIKSANETTDINIQFITVYDPELQKIVCVQGSVPKYDEE